MGLPLSTDRTMVGFMGCYAAFNGLKLAHAICQSQADARVLLVCVELCSLHFQIENTLESVVVNAIFSDGAAAAVLSSRTTAQAAGMLEYSTGCCQMDGDSMDAMTWTVGDTGYIMGLSSQVPDIIARKLPMYVESLMSRSGWTQDKIDFWAIHPGGRQVVDRAALVLGLGHDDLADSYETLRLHGNMSSPTILFVLKRILDRHREERLRGAEGYRSGVALAFGPGLTIEGCLIARVDAV
jgi:predicted naringenin-chalcone synthase